MFTALISVVFSCFQQISCDKQLISLLTRNKWQTYTDSDKVVNIVENLAAKQPDISLWSRLRTKQCETENDYWTYRYILFCQGRYRNNSKWRQQFPPVPLMWRHCSFLIFYVMLLCSITVVASRVATITLREFLQTCHKCPRALWDELIRYLVVNGQGHCELMSVPFLWTLTAFST